MDVEKAILVTFMLPSWHVLRLPDDNRPASWDWHQWQCKYGTAVLITQQRISAYVMAGDVFTPYELKLNSMSISQYTDHNSIINTNRLTLYRASNAFLSERIRDK